ncbi:MAG: hypothetical protein J0M04_16685 [Verrucomicrobia bacterium]|nr:hypothetical protein [Verrucomicrobiota bacterium]
MNPKLEVAITRASIFSTEELKITDSTEVIFDFGEILPIHQSVHSHFFSKNQFSQWISVYQWLIERSNYPELRISGSMSAVQRERTVAPNFGSWDEWCFLSGLWSLVSGFLARWCQTIFRPANTVERKTRPRIKAMETVLPQ